MTVVTLQGTPPGATTTRRCPFEAALAGATAEDLRVGTYSEFLYGRGEAPGVDLGRPREYTRAGAVYRQQFERGLTLANVGDVPAEVELERPYRDLDGVTRRRVVLAPRSAEVLAVCA